MAEHTPGPWTVSDTHPSDGWMGWNVKGGRAYICAVVDGCQSVDENYANACLIAAAPDLLAACEAEEKAETLRDYHERLMMAPISCLGDADRLRDSFAAWKDQVWAARELRKSAIAKARGETTLIFWSKARSR